MNPIERKRLERMEDVAAFRDAVKSIIGGAIIASLGWLIIHILFSV